MYPTEEGLVGLLKDPKAHRIPAVIGLFEHLANAHFLPEPAVRRCIAHCAFNELIRLEEYAAFVEAFALYNDIQRRHAEANGEPYQTQLVLEMRADWEAYDKEAMIAAFSAVEAQMVVVLCPPSSGELPIPADISDCIVALLQAGTQELYVEGPLEAAEPVAQAFANSQLTAIALSQKSVDYNEPEDVAETRFQSHSLLMAGLVDCRTLRHLTIGDEGLLTLNATLSRFLHGGGPALTTVELSHVMMLHSNHGALVDFMETLAQIPTLSALNAFVFVRDGQHLTDVFLDPFRHHPSLTKLEIDGNYRQDAEQRNTTVLPDVITFAHTCPQLTTFAWRCGDFSDEAGDFMTALIEEGGDLFSQAGLRAMQRAMVDPGFKLENLTLERNFFTPLVARTFCRALARNFSLRDLNFKRCFFDVEAVLIDLMAALQTNSTLANIHLNGEHKYFYFTLSNGRVIGFVRNPPGGAQKADGFTLKIDEEVDPELYAQAMAEFANLKPLSKTVFHDLSAKLAQSRRHASSNIANLELHENIKGLMNAMLMSSEAAERNKDDPEQYRLPAQIVMEHLSDSLSLPIAVHASRVSKGTDPYEQHVLTNPPLQAGIEVRKLTNVNRRTKERALELAALEKRAKQLGVSVATLRQTQANNSAKTWLPLEDHPMRAHRLSAAALAVHSDDESDGESGSGSDSDSGSGNEHDSEHGMDMGGVDGRHADREDMALAETMADADAAAMRTQQAWASLHPILMETMLGEETRRLHNLAMAAIAAIANHEEPDPTDLINAMFLGAPLNVVNDDGANMLLLAAAAARSPAIAHLLVLNGALDPDGLAHKSASSSAVASAIQGDIGPSQTTTNTTNTTVSNTNTNTNTNALATATAGAAVAGAAPPEPIMIHGVNPSEAEVDPADLDMGGYDHFDFGTGDMDLRELDLDPFDFDK